MYKPCTTYCNMAIVLLMLLTSINTKANVAAGELTYEWVSGNTYRVLYKGYFYCTGAPIPSFVNLCVTNTCNSVSKYHALNAITGNIPTTNMPNGSIVPIGCNKDITTCDNVSSTTPGFREFWYAKEITLDTVCNDWQFILTINSRREFDNIVSSNQHLRATLNNVIASGNSSPDGAEIPLWFVCSVPNQPYNFIHDFTDRDGDSITVNVINPLTHFSNGNLCPTTSANVAVKSYTPPITFPNNPIPTYPSTFVCRDSITYFQLRDTGDYLLTYQINEYRNGVQIGSTMRDVAVIKLQCKNSWPVIYDDTLGRKGLQHFSPGTFITCPGDTVRYCFDVKSIYPGGKYYVTNTFAKTTPLSVTTFSSQGTDSVRVCYNWLPQQSDTGTHQVRYLITDSTCYLPGNTPTRNAGFTMYVRSRPLVNITASPQNAWQWVEVNFLTQTTPCNVSTLQWYVNGVPVPGANQYTWKSTTLSDKDVVTCGFKCYDTLCLDTTETFSNSIVMDFSTSVYDIVSENQINLYPNPNNGSFTITMDNAIFTDDKKSIEIINSIGQTVYTSTMQTNEKQIIIDNLQTGIYLLNVQTDKGIYSKKFTVVK